VDNALSAQFEHTVLVTDTGYEILTDRSKVWVINVARENPRTVIVGGLIYQGASTISLFRQIP
jgi:hypothetical protein